MGIEIWYSVTLERRPLKAYALPNVKENVISTYSLSVWPRKQEIFYFPPGRNFIFFLQRFLEISCFKKF
jgi:hypothetical protein